MKTVGQVLKASCDWLKEKNSPHGRLEVEWMIASILHMKRLDLYLNFEKPIQDNELTLIRDRLKRLAAGEPLQYIEGEVRFCGCTFKVDSRVLIPRPETEQLVDLVIKELKEKSLEGKTVIDIGTGSGCIGISIKKALPALCVILSDISQEALTVAKENACRNNVKVEIDSGIEKFDFVVSNPPYISESEFETLEKPVKDFEPKMALVSGPTGLEVYEALAVQLKKRMNPSGSGWFEIGRAQGLQVTDILSKEGFRNIQVKKDLSSHDRFVFFTL